MLRNNSDMPKTLKNKMVSGNPRPYYNIEARFLTILVVQKQEVLHICVCVCVCLCSLRYPACNTIHIVTVLQYFPTLSHKQHDFRITVTENKMCILFCLQIFCEKISHSKGNRARQNQNCLSVFT